MVVLVYIGVRLTLALTLALTLIAGPPVAVFGLPAGQQAASVERNGFGVHPNLAFTRYWYYQYCMVYSIQTRGRKGSLILSNDRAIVLH